MLRGSHPGEPRAYHSGNLEARCRQQSRKGDGEMTDTKKILMAIGEDPDLPILQFVLPSKNEVVLSVLPGDRHAFLAGTLIETGRRQSVSKEDIDRLAHLLNTEATTDFEFRIHDIVVGFAVDEARPRRRHLRRRPGPEAGP